MSNQFIGLTMLVTLSAPPGAQLRGVVKSIEPGKSLTLHNVVCPQNGKYVPEFTINAAEIVELVEAVNENTVFPQAILPIPQPVAPKPKTFEDPAILSFGRRPTPQTHPPIPSSQSNSILMERVDSSRTAKGIDEGVTGDRTSTSTLIEPIQNIKLAEFEANDAVSSLALEELGADGPLGQPAGKTGRKARRRKHGRKAGEDLAPEHNVTPAKETTSTKGWRQTPLLEPNPSFQPFATLKKRNGRGKGKPDENGWATEDATDVQDMGDFDFAGSLAKFDKHTIFTQIQAEDSIAEEDRLVSHNRLPKVKPGTAGGKNLHFTENVLDVPSLNGAPKSKNEVWKSEAGDSEVEERLNLRDSGSGRQSRRAESKMGTNRRPPSRKGSSIATGIQPARASSGSRPLVVPPTTVANSNQVGVASSKRSFYLVPSNRRCEPISPLQMLNLENIADNELGLSEDMMTENAGRAVAEVALSALHTGEGGLTQAKSSKLSTIVIFAGNNKSGLRAVAAARHIRNHGPNVVVCVLGLEREPELLVGLRRQLKVFRSFGGKVVTKGELLEYIGTLETSIDLVIDGLLGLTISFEELRTGEQATVYELIEWANRSKAPVLAIDIPTGIEPTSGKINIIDGRQLYIHAKYVVAIGAPKKGLLEAMAFGEGISDEHRVETGKGWQLFVADIGLGAAVWKKAGTRVRRGVEFEGSWVVGMRFQGTVN